MTPGGPIGQGRPDVAARRGAVPGLALTLALTLVLAGCESTQEKSARIGAELGPVAEEKGLRIERRSEDVKVLGATLLSDVNGSAVVVELRNGSDRDLAEVPILIDVRDAGGKSVYRNDIPGIEPALAAVPSIPAGGEVAWVHDQVMASGEPARVEVTVGADAEPTAGAEPKVAVSAPKLEGDPYTGVAAGGEVVNESGEDVDRLLLYAVARKGGRVVAAGRGAIEPLRDRPKPVPYNVYFIGNPKGADLTIAEYATRAGRELG